MRGTGARIRIAVGILAGAALWAVPATAMADQPVVTPVANCITTHADGTFTALFGYDNSSDAVVTLTKGSDNVVTPSNLDGRQPETFTPGTVYGAFYTLPIPAGGTATWTLHGHRQAVASASSPTCGTPVPMPQEGNGLGVIIAMVIAAAFGLFMVVRSPKDPPIAVR